MHCGNFIQSLDSELHSRQPQRRYWRGWPLGRDPKTRDKRTAAQGRESLIRDGSPLSLPVPSDIIAEDKSAHQNPFPSWNLSNRRSNLSRVLSPEHANKSAGFVLGGPFPDPLRTLSSPSRIGYSFYIIFILSYPDPSYL